MVVTRKMSSEPKLALNHLCTKVLGEITEDGPFAKVFDELGVEDINSFMFIEQSHFKETETKLKIL